MVALALETFITSNDGEHANKTPKVTLSLLLFVSKKRIKVNLSLR